MPIERIDIQSAQRFLFLSSQGPASTASTRGKLTQFSSSPAFGVKKKMCRAGSRTSG
jgi:hypothetical protein